MKSTALVQVSGIRRALAQAKTLPQVRSLEARAKAIKLVLEVDGAELKTINKIGEILLLTKWKAGWLVSQVECRGRPKKDDKASSFFSATEKQRRHRYRKFHGASTQAGISKYCAKATADGEVVHEAGFYNWLGQRAGSAQVEEPEPPPKGRYRCIVIDPPWKMQKIQRHERPRQGGFEYPTMTEQQLEALQIPAADNAHLYCWTTHKHLPSALHLIQVWGFAYECLMTWVKNVGFTPFSWMRTTEHVLFCRKGNLVLSKKGLPLHFNAKVREHSRKPDEFYKLVKQATPGPRLDMFSRETREGFKSWGAEVGKLDA